MKIRWFLISCIISSSCSYQLPMVRAYKRLPELLHHVDKHKPLKMGASIIAAHGITDIVTKAPSTWLLGYFSGFTLTYISPIDMRYMWLVLGSTYHFSKDMMGPFKLIQSIYLHELFIQKPKWVYYYLLCVHTPLHYWSFFQTPGTIYYLPVCILFTWFIYKLPMMKFKSLCLFPVIGHIIIN